MKPNWPARVRATRDGENLVDRHFGETVVTEFWGMDPKEPSRRLWVCRCDCGEYHLARQNNLKSGNTRSCGHLHPGGRPIEQHGGYHSPAYSSWSHMIDRCENPNGHKFYLYGGKGIRVCDRWRGSFAAFLEDMGPRPKGKTIDRIDPSKGYEPGNCRWATVLEQNRNITGVMRVQFRDEGLVPVVELADRFGITRNALKGRVRKGLDIEAAIALGAPKPRKQRAAKEIPA